MNVIQFPITEEQFQGSIFLLLPDYLDDSFTGIFKRLRFQVLHTRDRDTLEKMIKLSHIDIALEWQHGPEDYSIRDLLRKHKRTAPVILLLNWNGQPPPNFDQLGYHDYVNVPFKIEEILRKFERALPESRKAVLRRNFSGRYWWPDSRK